MKWFTKRTSILEGVLGNLQERIECCQITCLNSMFELFICNLRFVNYRILYVTSGS